MDMWRIPRVSLIAPSKTRGREKIKNKREPLTSFNTSFLLSVKHLSLSPPSLHVLLCAPLFFFFFPSTAVKSSKKNKKKKKTGNKLRRKTHLSAKRLLPAGVDCWGYLMLHSRCCSTLLHTWPLLFSIGFFVFYFF